MPPSELTLILAATRDMGIGLNGTLPWRGLKKEMAYFARVTKRLPPAAAPPSLNAVIMGRKTWDSIPPRFRPLKGRLNVVLSRSAPSGPTAPRVLPAGFDPDKEPVLARSLEAGLAFLEEDLRFPAARVFVIGGAQIYAAALALPQARRILLTRILTDFECDTFFPLMLGEDDTAESRWKRRTKAELDGWVGETVPEGVQEEGGGTRYVFEMWERV